ncbi:MAG: histone deacetylase [Candidatus Calescibacterium sp.]|nr:histone deacetylase [Candidatus Calescibacterium sp.]MCX7733869.1 histone deacetylase [bacterium]MDW8086650.1 histone deacetylase [Candidatus Calescibacterium sp.]
MQSEDSIKQVSIVYDDYFLEHKPFYSHPENPARLHSIVNFLEINGLWRRLKHLPIDVDKEETLELLRLVHSEHHIELVEGTAGSYGNIDADTYYCPETHSVALQAASAAVRAVSAVMYGHTNKVFVLARPPGHHATFSEAMGFCFYNNAAVAAEKAKKMGAENIIIVDYDIHHGNGTQEIFYQRDDVLYFSTHRYPFYPGTGRFDEIGEGKGKGFTINVPLPSSLGDGEYAKIYEEIYTPIAQKFSPDLVIVSAGFDAHYKDPLGDMRLTEEGFAYISDIIIRATPKAKGFIFILEGGYNLEGLSESVKEVILTMAGLKKPERARITNNIDRIMFESQRYFRDWLTN